MRSFFFTSLKCLASGKMSVEQLHPLRPNDLEH